MFYLLNPKLWIALAVAVALSVGTWRVHSAGKASGRSEVQAKFDAYRLTVEKAQAETQAETLRKEADLIAKAHAEKRKSDEAHHRTRVALDTALHSLRNRPERPGDPAVPAPAAPGADPAPTDTACTGRDLYRPDAEFLARLFADTETLSTALMSCRAQYESAQRKTQ